MTLAHRIRRLAQRYGVEINRYIPSQSQEARLHKLLSYHRIDLIVDVGANNGGYAKSLRDGGFSGDILSFEPLTEPYQALVGAAATDPRWHVGPKIALGATDDEVEVNVAANSTSSSILPMEDLHLQAAPQSRYEAIEKVAVRRLDGLSHSIIDKSRDLFLKIDTQGYEMQVLLGAERTLKRTLGMQLELSVVPLYAGQSLYREIVEWLADRGFNLWSVIPGFTDEKSGRMLQFDGIFFREDVAPR